MDILLGLGLAMVIIVLSTLLGRILLKTWYSGRYGIAQLALCYIPCIIAGLLIIYGIPKDLLLPIVNIDWKGLNLTPNPWALSIPLILYAIPGLTVITD